MTAACTERILDNGLRVVCEAMPQVRSSAAAFYVRTGSRHEQPHEHGVSHFLEHMCFKGTAARTWEAINIRFDELGSIYNAFTGKEHTCYYGWVPGENLDPQLELLADMMRPALPPDEFQTERNVILEEIAMSGDSFNRHVFEFLHEVCFANTPLAHEILGEKETIEGLPRDVMQAYLDERYSPENMTLVVAGAVEPDAVFRSAEQYCGQWAARNDRPRESAVPSGFPTGWFKRQLSQFQQHSLIYVYPAAAPGSPDDELLDLFCSLFGGNNSRCYWNIVQRGICSDAGVAWLAYRDCGLLAFYADGEPERCAEMLAALRGEMDTVARDGFTEAEVEQAKNRRRTQLALESESPKSRLMQMLDDLEDHGRVRDAEERLAAVQRITPGDLMDYLRRYPITGEATVLSIGPRDWPDGSAPTA